MNEPSFVSLTHDKKDLIPTIYDYYNRDVFCDVTIACRGKYFHAHRLILSSHSEYFQEIFETVPCKHPVIIMRDFEPEVLSDLLCFIYKGNIEVSSEKVSSLIKAAHDLKVKDLLNSNISFKTLNQLSSCISNHVLNSMKEKLGVKLENNESRMKQTSHDMNMSDSEKLSERTGSVKEKGPENTQNNSFTPLENPTNLTYLRSNDASSAHTQSHSKDVAVNLNISGPTHNTFEKRTSNPVEKVFQNKRIFTMIPAPLKNTANINVFSTNDASCSRTQSHSLAVNCDESVSVEDPLCCNSSNSSEASNSNSCEESYNTVGVYPMMITPTVKRTKIMRGFLKNINMRDVERRKHKQNEYFIQEKNSVNQPKINTERGLETLSQVKKMKTSSKENDSYHREFSAPMHQVEVEERMKAFIHVGLADSEVIPMSPVEEKEGTLSHLDSNITTVCCSGQGTGSVASLGFDVTGAHANPGCEFSVTSKEKTDRAMETPQDTVKVELEDFFDETRSLEETTCCNIEPKIEDPWK